MRDIDWKWFLFHFAILFLVTTGMSVSHVNDNNKEKYCHHDVQNKEQSISLPNKSDLSQGLSTAAETTAKKASKEELYQFHCPYK